LIRAVHPLALGLVIAVAVSGCLRNEADDAVFFDPAVDSSTDTKLSVDSTTTGDAAVDSSGTVDIVTDALEADVAPADTSQLDALDPDAHVSDAHVADAHVPDAVVPDATPSDGAAEDAAQDVATADAVSMTDAAGVVDGAGPDASTSDAPTADASIADASGTNDIASNDIASNDMAGNDIASNDAGSVSADAASVDGGITKTCPLYESLSIDGKHTVLQGGVVVGDALVAVGLTGANVTEAADFYIARFDAAGKRQWHHRWGDPKGFDGLADALIDGKGRVAAVGTTKPFGGTQNGYLARFKANGTVETYRSYFHGAKAHDTLFAAALGSDGTIVAGGSTNDPDGHRDQWFIGVDNSNKLLWSRTYGAKASDHIYDLATRPAGGFFAVGDTQPHKTAKFDGQVMALDPNGRRLWVRTVAAQGHDLARQVVAMPQGGASVMLHSAKDFHVLRVDDAGEIIKTRTYVRDGDQEPFAAAATADGGLLVAGNTTEGGIVYRGFVARIAPDGALASYSVHGDGGFDLVEAILPADGLGAFVIGGLETKNNASEGWVRRIDAFGNHDCKAAGVCSTITPLGCDDGNPCTTDFCTPSGAKKGCQHTAITGCSVDADLDHDGLVGAKDPCPTAWSPDGKASACAAIPAKLSKTVVLGVEQPGIVVPWSTSRRTNEPVEAPLVNGVRNDELRVHLGLDGDAKDQSLFARKGSLVGSPKSATGAFGDVGGAIALDGKTQRVDVPNVGVPRDYTMALWVKVQSAPTSSMELIGNYEKAAGAAMIVYQKDNPTPRLIASNFAAGAYSDVSWPVELHGDGWHHVASTWSADNKRLSLFVDGRMVATRADGAPPSGTFGAGTTVLQIGRGLNAYPAHTDVDDGLVLSRALLPEEIAAYVASRKPFATSVVPGAQADFDDVAVGQAAAKAKPHLIASELIGARPVSDTAADMGAGWWRFDGSLDDAVKGLKGKVTDGAAKWASGRWGGKDSALVFDGATAVDSGYTFSADSKTGAFAIDAWVWLDKPPAADMTVIGATPTNTATGGKVRLFIGTNRTLGSSISSVKTGGYNTKSKGPQVPIGAWTHVGLVYEKGLLYFYVNGHSAGIGLHDKTGLIAPGISATIGATTDGKKASSFFTGRIDSLAVHKVARSAAWMEKRARGLPRLRFLARTAAKHEKGHYRFDTYTLHFGDPAAKAKATSIAGPNNTTCSAIVSPCLGYAAWWRMDRAGVSVPDAAASRTGLLKGATIAPGSRHHAAVVAMKGGASGQHIDAGKWSAPLRGGDFTVDMRLIATTLSQSYTVFWWLEDDQPSLRMLGNNVLQLQVNPGVAQPVTAVLPAATAGRWMAVAARYVAGSKRALLSVDGRTLGSKTGAVMKATGSDRLRLGWDSGTSKHGLPGAFGDVRIMNRAVADDELLKFPAAQVSAAMP